jgi:hypothetical protein
MIHCWPTVPPPSSARIWASATFTMEMSSVIKKNPIEATVITLRACGPLGGPIAGWAGRLSVLTDIDESLLTLHPNGVLLSG